MMNDKEMKRWVRTSLRYSLEDILKELKYLKKEVFKIKEQRRGARNHKKKEPSILSYKSMDLIERRLNELDKIHQDRKLLSDRDK